MPALQVVSTHGSGEATIMKPEIKLALIIGFGLVLVVAIIFADHISPPTGERMAARDASLGEVLRDRMGVDPRPPDRRDLNAAGEPLPGPEIDRTDQSQRADGRSARPGQSDTLLVFPPTEDNTDSRIIDELLRGERNGTPAARVVPRESAEDHRDSSRDAGNDDRNLTLDDAPPVIEMGARPERHHNPAARERNEIPLPGGEDEVNRVRVEARPYTVAKGDTLFEIAEAFYGDGSLYRALAAFNANVVRNEDVVPLGAELLIPSLEDLRLALDRGIEVVSIVRVESRRARSSSGSESRGGNRADTGFIEYTVQKGDSFSRIAKRTLGSEKRWVELYELNKSVVEEPDALVAGVVIRIPRS